MANFGKLAIPLLALIAIGAATRKKPKSSGSGGFEPVPGTDPRPDSDRMLFSPDCADLTVRVLAPDYDLRITNRYWQLRQEGVNDPQVIAADILAMDAPQCEWPPSQNATLRNKAIWELIGPAVRAYWEAEQAGTLSQYAQVFGNASGYIE